MIERSLLALAMFALAFGGIASAQTTAKKPNIVVIMADDVGAGERSHEERLENHLPVRK
jgi:hypothetical protein